jgi:hypothetical protein
MEELERIGECHDQRRSWISVEAALGYVPEFIGKVLGNSGSVNELQYCSSNRRLDAGDYPQSCTETVAGFGRLQRDTDS